ncbi:uncharacterized protein BDV14DRAFT_199425 [Aspergillus stella-maris]|uniref:uncharacterized protein n=1 Tax=Aspergillus stella-maris TaxID=1810926 RepID=UPI003CCD8FBB
MTTASFLHQVRWTPATLSDETLSFDKVVFVAGGTEDAANDSTNSDQSQRISAYCTQLRNEGYNTLTVNDPRELSRTLKPSNTSTIVVYIPPVASTQDDVYDAAVSACVSLTAVAQILNSMSSAAGRAIFPVKLFSLVPQTEEIGELALTPLRGLARVLKMEIPEIFGGLFELGNNSDTELPLHAIKHAQGFDVIRICAIEGQKGTVPMIASLKPLEQGQSDGGPERVKLDFNPDAAYLITGGTKGIGLEIASWMVEHGARTLLLVARKGLPSAGESIGANSKSLIQRIASFEAQGARVHVLSVDLGLSGAEEMLRDAIDGLGEIPAVKGVVHAAGIAGYHTLKTCSREDIASVFAPKVTGALCLDAMFPPESLDFFVLMSSIGQLVGFPGQMSYAPANAFLDGLASRRRRQGDKCISIQWTSWEGVGMLAQSKSTTRMVTKGMKDRGIAFINKDQALDVLGRILKRNTDHVAVVRALEIEEGEPLRHQILEDITPRRVRKVFSDYPENSVAVISMACRTAAGDTEDDLWRVLESGSSMVREVDETRFPEAAGKAKSWGNFLSDIEGFDHKFFGKSKREAAALDPHQRLLLETTYHALEAAGWVGHDQCKPETHEFTSSKDITGCFIGMTAPDYTLNLGSHAPSPYTGTGMLRSFAAGRLSHYFGWTGPSHVIDTACSSSMVAIHQACRAIQTGECTRAVAGGVNLITNMVLFDAMRVGGFLSNTGACKTFDAGADGYCRGEGVGVVALKPLQKALDDGDDIQGVLLSTGNNQNLNGTSITNPVLASQIALYQDVLTRSNVAARDISYVEAHGTGTRAGDPAEVEGIRQVLGRSEGGRETSLHIGAIKANIGHAEGAAGVLSLIKVLLMMKHGKIPPQAHFKTLNPNISALEPDHLAIPTTLRGWTDDMRLSMVNSYGASGNNAAAIVAPPPAQLSMRPTVASKTASIPASASSWPIFISAASEHSLLAYSAELVKYIGKNLENISLAHLSYALSTKMNRDLQYTISTTATSLEDFRSQLRCPDPRISHNPSGEVKGKKPIVLLFSGQNGNTVPSARLLYETSPYFRKRLEECEEAIHALGLPSIISSVIDGIQSNDKTERNAEEASLIIRHAALFSLQYACGMSWMDSGVAPRAICGHSFGEWAALTVSGALTLEAGMRLVTGRASIIQRRWGDDTGSMIAIETDIATTKTTPDEHFQSFFLNGHPKSRLEIACYNGPKNYVVAGSTPDIEILAAYLQEQKSKPSHANNRLRFKVLRGMHAYHCSMADGIIDECATLSASIPFKDPKFPFETCHRGAETGDEEGSYNIIARNTRGSVYFGDAIQRIVHRLGSSCTFLEAGIGGPIVGMAQNALAMAHSNSKPKAEHTFIPLSGKDPRRSLADATVALWKTGAVHVRFWPFEGSQRRMYLTDRGNTLDLPPYRFDKQRHWLEYKPSTSAKNEKHVADAQCPHCSKNLNDFPYIVRKTPSLQTSTSHISTFKIDTRSQRYRDLVGGHLVVGTPISPAAMYLELATHALLLIRNGKDTHSGSGKRISVTDLQIKAPMTLYEDATRSVKLTLTERSKGIWDFEFISVAIGTESDRRPISHSTGTIHENTNESQQRGTGDHWTQMSRLLEDDQNTDALRGNMVYKIFSTMAKYSAPYKGLRYLVGKGSSAAGDIVMPRDTKVSPAPIKGIVDVPLIDNFFQVAGAFVHTLRVPVGEEINDPDDASGSLSYICTGVGSVGPLDQILGSERYRAHTEVVQDNKKDVSLNLFAFDCSNQELVWSAKGIKFTRVPRSSLAKALAGTKPSSALRRAESLPISGPQSSGKAKTVANNDIIDGVSAILSKSLDVPVAEITERAVLEDLGIDSLVTPEILVGIKDRFNVDISTSDFLSAQTVGSLCELIASRKRGTTVEDSRRTDSASDLDPNLPKDWRNTVIAVLGNSLELEAHEITMSSRLEELGIDSLVTPEILLALYDKLNVEISTNDFLLAQDVASLCDFIASRLGFGIEDKVSISASRPGAPQQWQKAVLDVLSRSLELEAHEIKLSSRLEELGADSLVAPEIVSNINEALGLEISSIDFASADDVQSLCELVGGALGLATPSASSPGSTVWSPSDDAGEPRTPSSEVASPTHVDSSGRSSWESRSVRTTVSVAAPLPQPDKDRSWFTSTTSILVSQGDKSSPLHVNLWLAPDGRGYGTVFNPLGQHLAQTGLPISVYALNSPFTVIDHRTVGDDVPTIEEMAASYLAEIKRRQPKGPYLLGGYSFGGLVAYEVARQLLEAEDEVTKLILFDTACPTWATHHPDNLFEYMHAHLPAGVNLTKSRRNTRNSKDNDDNTVNATSQPSGEDGITLSRKQLKLYKITKLPGLKMPHTILVSARHGLNISNSQDKLHALNLSPEEMKIATWFLDDRVDDGPLGWDELLGAGNVDVVRADSNHFTVVLPTPTMGEWVSELVELLGV